MVSRLIRLGISLVVFGGDFLVRLVGGRRAGSCVVINYHSVHDETRERFARQCELVLKLARPVFAARELSFEKGSRYVAITADDAFCSFIKNGVPEMVQRKIPVTLFVPTGYLGRRSSWDDYGGPNQVGEELVTAEDLKRLAVCETIDFGSHGVNHPDLAKMTEAEARRELKESKDSLIAITRREIKGVSFPYGSYGDRELKLVSETGYQFCFGSTAESVSSALRGGLMGRVSVQPTDWELEFKLKVLGAYRWVKWASSGKRSIFSLLKRN
ncbi:polysaccharide deacetylase family protein [Pedosphaera parvula]|uniref:Polysaccharide deacetylase n=1 Tax=Pedosphaera parvula (strain Ellin514) TaxID=320771 RepID=B9XD36_PEDPL|nr:polysaccharide deacetylase family protein [Pedosphaera parvula]EEF62382.1 polysaccharide deacetylase [Pedosphaera parvula Ellin514]